MSIHVNAILRRYRFNPCQNTVDEINICKKCKLCNLKLSMNEQLKMQSIRNMDIKHEHRLKAQLITALNDLGKPEQDYKWYNNEYAINRLHHCQQDMQNRRKDKNID